MYPDTLMGLLSSHGQEHLIKFWPELSESEREQLTREIIQIDLAEVTDYFLKSIGPSHWSKKKDDDELMPIPDSHYESVPSMNSEKIKEYERIGFEEISASKVGVLLLAGGQATRLGFMYPKGMFNVGLPSGKSLFQLQAERILRLQELAANATGRYGIITWYIMTSEHTMAPTKKYMEENDFFGLDKENIIYFKQGRLPCFDLNGKILLDAKHHLSTAPDGNGGLYKALKTENILLDINNRCIHHLHAHSVDNILIKVADPVFIGYCKSKNADCAAKVVQKSYPKEAVGVVCKVNGAYKVVEYSELTSEQAEQRNNDGRLTYSAGNICNHYFSSEFLSRVCDLEPKLQHHIAMKKIPYIDDNGVRQVSKTPNGIKMEKFIFDVFEFAQNFICLEVAREIEFSALKNADCAKKDCPSTAREDLLRLHRIYIRNAGGEVSENVDIEISPLLSYGGENLEEFCKNEVFSVTPFHLKSIREGNTRKTNGKH